MKKSLLLLVYQLNLWVLLKVLEMVVEWVFHYVSLTLKLHTKSLPEHLDVDVTALTIGKSIKVGQLSYEGLELVTGKDVVVCSIKMTRAASMAAQAAKEGK